MQLAAAIRRELTADRRTDGELVAAFLADHSEAAFAELVRRHGPLVWGACRRLLPDLADAEDAFQASFLVLVRRARRLTREAALGPWLHRVAVWTARNVRRKNARRLARQTALPDHVIDSSPAPDFALKTDLDAALLALPSRYRDPILLCHLQGMSRREAAERLGCAEGTLSAWLSRGLAKLRDRLRGLDPSKPLSVATAVVPAALATNTARAAVASCVAAASVPPAVSVLVEGVLHMFWVKKATAATLALCAVFALGVGTGLGTRTEVSLAQEKGSVPKTGTVPKAQSPTNLATKVAALEEEIQQLERTLSSAKAGIAQCEKRIELFKKNQEFPIGKELLECEAVLARFRENRDTAGTQLEIAKTKLANLKNQQMHAAALELQVAEAVVKAISQQLRLEKTYFEYVKKQGADPKVLQAKQDAITVSEKQLEVATTQLAAARANLAALEAEAAVNLAPGYVELTVTRKGGKHEFVIKEVPPHDLNKDGAVRVYGPVTTGDSDMLAKLLARTRADATAPKELRVIAVPQPVLGPGPQLALKACDTAGYKSVKFTGYVFGGGFATRLEPDQKGEVRGYTRYENAEKRPAELAKEIEDGMSRY